MQATQAWEQTNVAEVTILPIAGGGYRGWYTGGYTAQAIGTFTMLADGVTITKYASNPIVGQGANGISGSCGRSSVVDTGGFFHMFFNKNNGTSVYHCKSVNTDGVTFDTPAIVFPIPSWGSIFGNVSIVIDSGTWHMMYECLKVSDGHWAIGHATSPDGLVWTDQTPAGPLTDLQVGSGAYGGPDLHGSAGAWELYLHAAASASNVPTNIYKSTSTDLVTWTSPILQVGRSLAWEVDQVADPFVMTQGALLVMYLTGEDNPHETGKLTRAVHV